MIERITFIERPLKLVPLVPRFSPLGLVPMYVIAPWAPNRGHREPGRPTQVLFRFEERTSGRFDGLKRQAGRRGLLLRRAAPDPAES